MVLRNMTIGTRLAFGFGAILAIMMVVSVGGTALGTKSRTDLAAVSAAASAKERVAADMKELVLERSSVMRNVGLLTDFKAMQGQEKVANDLSARYIDARANMSRMELSPAERAVLENLDKLDAQVKEPFKKAIELQSVFRNEEAVGLLMNEVDPAITKTMTELDRLSEMQKKANEDATKAALVTGDRLATTTYVVEAVVLVMAVLLAWAITRSIVAPLRESVSIAKRVASGDLTSQIVPSGQGRGGRAAGGAARHERGPRPHRAADPHRVRVDRRGRQPGRLRQPAAFQPHRGARELARGDRLDARGVHHHRAPERRAREAGEPARRQRLGHRRDAAARW